MHPTILLIYEKGNDDGPLTERFTAIGFRVLSASILPETTESIKEASVIVLNVPLEKLVWWVEKIRPVRRSPLVWQCPFGQTSGGSITHDVDIDGMLCSGMTPPELRIAFELSEIQYRRRMAWAQEREALLKSLEERKWVEKAKGILSEMKNIPEDEAYVFLRKQAMSERRKITDVAKSIVNVYSFLQEGKRK